MKRRRLRSPRARPLVRVSRVLLIEGRAAAWMVDVVPEDVVGVGKIRERFRPGGHGPGSVGHGRRARGYSQMSIGAVMIGPGDPSGSGLAWQSPSAALSLIQTMYLTDGRPAQWSRDTFLPGHLDLHVVRELFEVRRLS